MVTEAVRRNVLTGEREIQRRKKEIAKAVLEDNKRLMSEKKQRHSPPPRGASPPPAAALYPYDDPIGRELFFESPVIEGTTSNS